MNQVIRFFLFLVISFQVNAQTYPARPGAGGAVGIAHAARQKADGCTLLWGLNSFLSIPEVEEITGRPSTFQTSLFAPVALAVIDEPVLAVRADGPWKNMAEAIRRIGKVE